MNPTDIKNRTLLSEFLGVSYATLRKYLTQPPVIIDHTIPLTPKGRLLFARAWLIRFSIRKRNTQLGHRIVYQAKQASLGYAHKAIYAQLLESYKPTATAHGFVKGRGIASNASQHLGKKTILACDIKDFFESITVDQVERVFIDCGFLPGASADLAKLCTLDGHLVQGYVTSPMIANMVATQIDADLSALASATDTDYTRYADDMTFSSNATIPDIEQVREIVERHGFELNNHKTRLMFRGEKQYVTGLTVFDATLARAPRRFKQRIRLLLYYMGKYGKISFQLKKMGYNREDYETNLETQSKVDFEIVGEDKRLKGWIDFINSVEPNRAAVYYKQYNSLKE
jgi:retron-type reverse transcriptase